MGKYNDIRMDIVIHNSILSGKPCIKATFAGPLTPFEMELFGEHDDELIVMPGCVIDVPGEASLLYYLWCHGYLSGADNRDYMECPLYLDVLAQLDEAWKKYEEIHPKKRSKVMDSKSLSHNMNANWHGIESRMDDITALVDAAVENHIGRLILEVGRRNISREISIPIVTIPVLRDLDKPIVRHWFQSYCKHKIDSGKRALVVSVKMEATNPHLLHLGVNAPRSNRGKLLVPHTLWVEEDVDPNISGVMDSNGIMLDADKRFSDSILIHD